MIDSSSPGPATTARARRLQLALALGAGAATLLPAPWALPLVAACAGSLLALRPALRERLAIGIGLAVACAALGGGWLLDRRALDGGRDLPSRASRAYAELWAELERRAAAGARAVATPPRDSGERLAAFRALADLAAPERTPDGRLAFLLVDADGEAVAWAGEGLPLEPRGDSLPASGPWSGQSYGAATIAAVAPLAGGGHGWRVVAGKSRPTQQAPFEIAGVHPASVRWSIESAGLVPPTGAIRVTAPPAPALLLEPPFTPASRYGDLGGRWARALAGLTLLALATMRAVGLLLLAGTVVRGRGRALEVSLLSAAGAGLWALAAGSGPWAAAALSTAILAAAAGASLGRAGLAPAGALAAGAVAGVLCGALAGVLHSWRGSLDLAGTFGGGAEAMTWRLALAASAVALATGSAALSRRAESADGWAWAAATLLLVGAALHDRPMAGWSFLIAGFACSARWLAGAEPLRRASAAGVLLLLACLGSALGWETAHRRALRQESARLLPLLRPPTQDEMRRLDGEARSHLAALAIRRARGVGEQDLAFTLWRRSPLARRNSLSGLAVREGDEILSSFSFGLPLAEGDLDREPGRWEALHLPAWDETLVSGEVSPPGAAGLHLRYWLLPRPGFLLGGIEEHDIELALLRSDPAQQEAVEGLPDPLAAALYGTDGRALRSPWRESPPLPPGLRQVVDPTEVGTPAGRAWGLARRGADGFEAIFLPLLGARTALDRVGTHALSALLLLAGAALLAVLLGLPRVAFRDALRRAVRSYSKRLMLVFTLLLLVPLLLFNAVLVRGLEDRLQRQQRAAGEAAITAAQRVLGEYVLTLEPGFSLGTALDDRLLVWLASVVHRDVNLYWGSSLYASSRRELFTAGVLPRRIPGEVFERLSLLGYGIAARTSHAGGTRYLELYAPLRVPGAPAGEGGLALSMPLLAQQEEAAAELARLRRQAVLGTAALFLLLVAIGTRLARSFTRPLMELVRGTQRIAAGAASLDVAPEELELQALAEAIDRMARRIAEGRSRLLREKQVVERMVENITAGVVSLDADRRIVMPNRVAGQLLGVLPGERLPRALAARENLRPVAEFVDQAGGEPRQSTVRIAAAGGEREWTLVWVPVPGAGEPAALLVVEDATEVLRGQRLEAWAEMARIIAHEIKNPLTPIRLSAEHMREVYASDPERFAEVFERCTANILRQVEELRTIASEFSAYSRIPRLDPQPGDLVRTVAEVVEAYSAAPPQEAHLSLHAGQPAIAARFDAKLLGRAVRNLLENALRVCGPGGRVEVTVERRDGEARIAVADSGPGVPADVLPRIFDPYFSTHAAGTGLGLPIARRIAEEHGGRIEAGNRPGGGFEVAITMPLS